MKWLVVVNPAAGGVGDAGPRLAALGQALQCTPACAYTDGPGAGTRIARGAREFDGLIVLGGDGTISECLTGMDLPRQKLAVLPAGHGMCLVRDLGLQAPERALAALRQPVWRAIDLMDVVVECDGTRTVRRLCASTVAVGYVADVVCTGRRRLAALGRAAYGVAAFVTLPRSFVAGASTDPDAPDELQPLTGVVVNNTAHLANFHAFPDARIDDGRLDVMSLGGGWLRQQAHNLAVLSGSAAIGPRSLQQSARFQLRLPQSRPAMVDGEMLDRVTSLRIECRSAAVTCATVTR